MFKGRSYRAAQGLELERGVGEVRVPDLSARLSLEGVVHREMVVRAHNIGSRYGAWKHHHGNEEEQQ